MHCHPTAFVLQREKVHCHSLLRHHNRHQTCSKLSEKLLIKEIWKWTYNGQPRWDIQLVCTTWSNKMVFAIAGNTRTSKLASIIESRGCRSDSMMQHEGFDWISRVNRWNLPTVDRKRMNIGWLTISCKVRCSLENNIQPDHLGLSIRIWDLSKVRITRGQYGPLFESNRLCGSMNQQSFLPASLTPQPQVLLGMVTTN